VDFLNAGGISDELKSHFKLTSQDLNNDTAPEILLTDQNIFANARMYLFACQNGKYVDTAIFPNDYISFDITILSIADNNRNSFPEVFIKEMGNGFIPHGFLDIVEWDGVKFIHRIKESSYPPKIENYPEITSFVNVAIRDVDKDGIKELTWSGVLSPKDSADYWLDYPMRAETHTYKWDGLYYLSQPVEYAAPEYRFQAVQDGDSYASLGQYEKALQSYQLAIQSQTLDWWTRERRDYILGQHQIGPCYETPSSCPTPTPNPNERPLLSAYASYRMILTNILMNEPQKAESQYQAMLKAYPQENAGFPFVEMATAFWTEYQSAQNLSNACEKAVAYATAHRNILSIIGGDYHGKSRLYTAQDVCPLK
jgi:tetratricopeptide (TPR) repeat protein